MYLHKPWVTIPQLLKNILGYIDWTDGFHVDILLLNQIDEDLYRFYGLDNNHGHFDLSINCEFIISSGFYYLFAGSVNRCVI